MYVAVIETRIGGSSLEVYNLRPWILLGVNIVASYNAVFDEQVIHLMPGVFIYRPVDE